MNGIVESETTIDLYDKYKKLGIIIINPCDIQSYQDKIKTRKLFRKKIDILNKKGYKIIEIPYSLIDQFVNKANLSLLGQDLILKMQSK